MTNATVAPEVQAPPREWHAWQPNRTQDSTEADDWREFMAWCDQYAGYTERTVPIIKLGTPEPKEPDWCVQVYGGRR